MATGMAKGAAARNKRVAFGDGNRIIWDQNSEQIFRNNPNIASPDWLQWPDKLEWVDYYKGSRKYNKLGEGRWIWNYDFRATPGEIFFDEVEKLYGTSGKGYVVIEPCVPRHKSVAYNKQWPHKRYDEVALRLISEGYRLLQFRHKGATHLVPGARPVVTKTFRLALSILGNSLLYIGTEGGLHHGAASLGVKGVVLFGGFVPPQVTGYDTHINLTGGAEACGSLRTCAHCIRAMDNISVDEVVDASLKLLRNGHS